MKILDKPDSVGHWWYRSRYHGQKFCTNWNIIKVQSIDDGDILCAGEWKSYYFMFETIGRKSYYQFVKAEPPPMDLK